MHKNVSDREKTHVYFAETKSIVQTRRKILREYNKLPATNKSIRKWFENFLNNGSLSRKKESQATTMFSMIQ